METLSKIDKREILEIFNEFKNDKKSRWEIEIASPIIFGNEYCEVELLMGYEKTPYFLNLPTSVFLRYLDELMEMEGIYKKADLASSGYRDDEYPLTFEQADELLGDYGNIYYYTEMGLSPREKFEISDYIIDRLILDLYSEYRYSTTL